MVEDFKRRYAAVGDVLYPLQARDTPVFSLKRTPTVRNASPVFAYAGSIYEGYERTLASLASLLKQSGGRLVIYSQLSEEYLKRNGLQGDNITVRAPIPSEQLIQKLREEADVLCVTMSFKPEHRIAMSLSFPSKLADYTAVGLPLLICGPPSCAAVHWARANPGVAEIVCQEDEESLASAVEKLVSDPEYRYALATKAVEKGREYFSHAVITKQFYNAISNRPDAL